MVEYIVKKGNLRDISCKMRDAGFDVSFRDCPAKGGTGGHPIACWSRDLSSHANDQHLKPSPVKQKPIILFVVCKLLDFLWGCNKTCFITCGWNMPISVQ
jgi:hypothetical protein